MRRPLPTRSGFASALLVLPALLASCSLSPDIAERGLLPTTESGAIGTASSASAGASSLIEGGRRGGSFEQLGESPRTVPLSRRTIGGQRVLPSVTGTRTVRLEYRDVEANRVVREVVQDVLGLPVQVDPSVTGRVNLVLPTPAPVSEVPRLLDEALRPLGLGIASIGGRVRAGRIAELEAASGDGQEQRVVPLASVPAADIVAAIQTSLPEGVRAQAEAGGRAISLTGPPGGVAAAQDLIGLFDTDALRGRSFGVYTLTRAAPAAVARELEQIFSGVRGVTVAPVLRSNAVLVVTDRPDVLARARRAIQGLDTAPEGSATAQVVPVVNRRAGELAEILGRAFDSPVVQPAGRASPAGAFGSLSVGGGPGTSGLEPRVPGGVAPSLPDRPDQPPFPMPGPAAMAAPGQQPLWAQLGLSAPIRIQADPGRNALLVLGAPSDAAMVVQAIRRLDQPQRQVFIEAVIAEVTLSDDLRFGINFSANIGDSVLSLLPALANPTAGALSFVFSNRNASVVLQALSAVTDVRVVSAPRVLVLDNETATLQVGDQVPLLTQFQQSTQASGAPVVSSVQLRDTGVILAVRPRIGAGGSVALDLFQEVSDATQTNTSTINSPTIQVRRVQSTIVARTGDTIALGGLMRDRAERDRRGIPLLSSIPYVGFLFGGRSQTVRRTELLVLLTPRVVEDTTELRGVLDEMRARIGSLAPELATSLRPPPPVRLAPRPPPQREPVFAPSPLP